MKYLLLLLCVVSFNLFADDALIVNTQRYDDPATWSRIEVLQHRLEVQPANLWFLLIFVCAVIHSFFAPTLLNMAEERLEEADLLDITMDETSHDDVPGTPYKFTFKTFWWELVYFFGEIEVVFGLWAIPLVIVITSYYDWDTAINYLYRWSYDEPLYLLASMTIASTYPIIRFFERIIEKVVSSFGGTPVSWWAVLMCVGPFVGSVLKESVVMTILAILLGRHFYVYKPSTKLTLATLSLLFVNVAAGGTMTNFASSSAYMVSVPWGWDSWYMFSHFGWKAFIGIYLCTGMVYWMFRSHFLDLNRRALVIEKHESWEMPNVPFWITFVHLLFLLWIIINNHQPILFIAALVLFIGFYQATGAYQTPMSIRTPVLVGFFIASLIVHAGLQGWWVEALLEGLSEITLMGTAMLLSAFNHNTTVAYLATFVPNITESMKMWFFQGAVAAGGLTLISNSPNLIGYKLIGRWVHFPIKPISIFYYSLLPTLLMALVFILLSL